MTPAQKRFLSCKIPLAWIMKNGIPAYQECTLSSIENYYILGIPQVSNKSDEIRWIGCDPATLRLSKKSFRQPLKLLDVLLSQDITTAERQRILWKEFDIILEPNGNLNNRSNFPDGYSGPLVEDLIEEQEKLLSHLECIESLMNTTDLSVEQAMNALNIPEEEQALYLSLLRKR